MSETSNELSPLGQAIKSLRDQLVAVKSAADTTSAKYKTFVSGMWTLLTHERETILPEIENWINDLADNEVEDVYDRVPMFLKDKLNSSLSALTGLLNSLDEVLHPGPDRSQDQLQHMASQFRRTWTDFNASHQEVIVDFLEKVETGRKIKMLEQSLSSEDRAAQLEAIRKEKEEFRLMIQKAGEARERLEKKGEVIEKKAEEAQEAILTQENVTEWQAAIDLHIKEASRWLIGGIGLAAFSFYILLWVTADVPLFLRWGPVFRPLPSGADISQIVAYAVNKVAIFSFLLVLIMVTIRSYQGHMHNLIISRQRKLSIIGLSRLAISLRGLDDTTRLQIVKQATLSIFSHSDTGFLMKSNSDVMPIIEAAEKIAEIAKK